MIRKETKGKFSNYSPAFAYFVPGINQKIKVERVFNKTYVANFKDGPERISLKDIKDEQWQCLGKWEELNEEL